MKNCCRKSAIADIHFCSDTKAFIRISHPFTANRYEIAMAYMAFGGIPYYFTEQEFTITKDYDHILRHKLATFIEETKTRKSVQLVFVTSSGLLRNMYSGRVQAEVILDDLFV